ncbi:rod-binding protein [Epibacterium ulvae]|uniref:rod-binding protein n=1 Tax=Epibacterium ulvae TaxID=1156985 RepID=UPI001BFC51DF|nr:rod-binding protein [Epibacterium ulvae]MBT8155772.1 rod-binding protein [Epibacterium ulvae]
MDIHQNSTRPSGTGTVGTLPNAEDPARKAAMDLESAFLAEMLKAAGLGKARDSFGGGAGEDHFTSFLVEAQAKQMTKAGGIGLAESLYHALKDAQND